MVTGVVQKLSEISVAVDVSLETTALSEQGSSGLRIVLLEPAHVVVAPADTLPRTKHAAPRHVCSSDLFSDITFSDRCTAIDLMFCNSVECR